MEFRGCTISFATILIFYCAFQICSALNCDNHCRSCVNDLKCGLGVKPIVDECGCCTICPKQLHEECDSESPCDSVKGLYCTFSESNKGLCVATPGRSCFVGNNVYLNGESFARGARYSCTCYDSDVVCKPLCPPKRTKFTNCAQPRLIRKPGKSCQELVCSVKRMYNNVFDKKSSPMMATKPGPFRKTTHRRFKCPVRQTRWSSCSKTCGWGISHRLTNVNKDCKITKEIRLCQIRHCEESSANTKVQLRRTKHKASKKNVVVGTPVRYSFLGCKSKVYIPRYCPKSCVVKRAVTVPTPFMCGNRNMFQKDLMIIKSCDCKSPNSV